MSVRVFPLPQFEGEDARGVVGDFGPFGIEMIEFQVFRARPHFFFWKRGKWVCIKSTFFDADKGLAKGYTLGKWTEQQLGFLRAWIEDDIDKARARSEFYDQD